MALPEFTRALTEKRLTDFCNAKVPVHVRGQLRIAFEIKGNDVTIIEERAPWRQGMTGWTRMPIAKLKYAENTNKWKLYCADRNGKWHHYKDMVLGIEEALEEIDTDSTGIFWG